MYDLKWSPPEKKIARAAFDEARDIALAKVMTEFKAKANAAATPFDMWKIEDYLREQRREINEMFDYRYSQLPLIFARLVREEYLDERLLAGLSDDKRQIIRSILS
jgi:hypothetical protein